MNYFCPKSIRFADQSNLKLRCRAAGPLPLNLPLRLRNQLRLAMLLIVATALLGGCKMQAPPDEPKAAGVPATRRGAEARFPPADADHFKGMDITVEPSSQPTPEQLDTEPPEKNPTEAASNSDANDRDSVSCVVDFGPPTEVTSKLSEPEWTTNEIKGRNAWILWTAGNEAFWDWLARHGYGTIDLLQVIDSRNRKNRFARAGMINEPGMRRCTEQEAKQLNGIYVDRPQSSPYPKRKHKHNKGTEDSEPSPYQIGDTKSLYYDGMPDPKVYGYSTGVVGLRLFPNPEFTGAAKRRWDAKRYYSDASYAANPSTIRPFRVGMSCAFCHVAPHPLNPPDDPEAPKWENLSSIIGNQYLRVRETFGNQLDKSNYFYHVLDSQLPGTIDTSLIPSDNINNANTMNAVFGLRSRVRRSLFNPAERLDPESENYPGVWEEHPYPNYPLADVQIHERAFEGNPRHVPRILVDGSDSVGSWIALARVYFNIGSYHQNWIRLHNTIIGLRDQDPFKLHDADMNSVNWHATLLRIDPMTEFFLRASQPMKLRDAAGINPDDLRGGGDTMAKEHELGREVFAKTCIACHSSIQPGDDPKIESLVKLPDIENRKTLRLEMSDLWRLTRGDGQLPKNYLRWANRAVMQKEFWEDNFLSTDQRIPVTMVRTQSARAVGTNAIHGEMWEDFSSNTYKELAAVDKVRYHDPFSQTQRSYQPPGGGPGYYRVPTLISAWSTAPFFHNNSLGQFNNDPSVKGRLEAYNDAIDKLLRPEKRVNHDRNSLSDLSVSENQYASDKGLIWRTSAESYFVIENHQIPGLLFGLTGWKPSILAVVPWLPALGALGFGLILLLYGVILERTHGLRKKLYWLEFPWLIIRWLFAIAIFLSVLALGGTLFYFRTAINDWNAILNFQGPWIWLQAWLGLLLIAFLGYLVIQSELPLPHFQRKQTRFAGAICLGISCLFALLLGQFAAGKGADIRIGPFPKGMPVNLIANINPDAPLDKQLQVATALREYLTEVRSSNTQESGYHSVGSESLLKKFEREVAPALMEASKCPDLVMDRGHDYVFLKQLSEKEKDALACLIKTF